MQRLDASVGRAEMTAKKNQPAARCVRKDRTDTPHRSSSFSFLTVFARHRSRSPRGIIMHLSARALVWGLFAAVAPLVTGCNEPSLVLEKPTNGEVVASPVAARISWSAINTLQNGIDFQVDGVNANSQFQIGTAIVTDAATAMLNLPNGAHSLTASASLLDTSTNQYVSSTVTSNFQVVSGLFDLSATPNPLVVTAGQSATATVSVVRTSGYSDSIALTFVGLPTGVTSAGGSIAAGESSTTITLSADAQQAQAGQFQAMLTGTGTSPPARTILFPVTVLQAAPTFTAIYTNYFAQGKAGHCYNCHYSGGPGSPVFQPMGPTQVDFYNALVASKLINTVTPAASPLISPTASPLAWFNTSGNMPADNPVPNAPAAADIAAWVAAGALNN